MTTFLLVTAAVVVGLALGVAGGRAAYRAKPPPPPVGPGAIDLTGYRLDVPAPPDPPPWWQLVPHAVELPLDLIRRFAVPADVQRAGADRARVDHIRALTETEGIRAAMCIRVDEHGRAVLEDGHHRLEVAALTGAATWPVEFKPSDRITGYGRPVLWLVAALAELVKAGQPSGHRSDP